MITREADYAIRIILSLGSSPEDAWVPASSISRQMDIPYRFLRKITNRLVGGGLIRSQRGKGGGLQLARPPKLITLGDVIGTVDSAGKTLNLCVASNELCARAGFCAARTHLCRIQNQIDQLLSTVSFAEMLESKGKK